ncbi:MAG: DivIVA domain-containing protein [Nocardioidaceae bacterium]
MSELAEPRFRLTSLREGYAPGEVDAAVDRVLASLRGEAPPLTRSDIEALAFDAVRLNQGYDMSDVDTWFDLVADTLDGGGPTMLTGPAGWPTQPVEPVEPDLRVFDGRMAAVMLPLLGVLLLVAVLVTR